MASASDRRDPPYTAAVLMSCRGISGAVDDGITRGVDISGASCDKSSIGWSNLWTKGMAELVGSRRARTMLDGVATVATTVSIAFIDFSFTRGVCLYVAGLATTGGELEAVRVDWRRTLMALDDIATDGVLMPDAPSDSSPTRQEDLWTAGVAKIDVKIEAVATSWRGVLMASDDVASSEVVVNDASGNISLTAWVGFRAREAAAADLVTAPALELTSMFDCADGRSCGEDIFTFIGVCD